MSKGASKAFLKALADSRTGWSKLSRAKCDLCNRAAIWRHIEGGLRCGKCDRPAGRVKS